MKKLKTGEKEPHVAVSRCLAGDHGPQERWQHVGRMLELTEKAGAFVARALEADLLDSLVLENVIAPRHREAALRFRADFQAAGMSAHLAGSYNPARSGFSFYGGWDERTEAEELAYKRWRQAVVAMEPMFSGTVISAVCYDEKPSSEKLVLLTVGLIKLMKWYAKGASDGDIHKTAARQIGRGAGCSSGRNSRN